MNVNEPNRSVSSSSAATARARTGESPEVASERDLAELVRSLCALAAESPERQSKIQSLMREYASGNLQVNAQVTASAIVDDAFDSRFARR